MGVQNTPSKNGLKNRVLRLFSGVLKAFKKELYFEPYLGQMTDEYKELLKVVQGLNSSNAYAITEEWLYYLLDGAEVSYERIEYELPSIVIDFSEVPVISIDFVLTYEDGHKRQARFYFNEHGNLCKTFIGLVTK